MPPQDSSEAWSAGQICKDGLVSGSLSPRVLLVTATDGLAMARRNLEAQMNRLAQQECEIALVLVVRGDAVLQFGGAEGVSLHTLRVPLRTSLSRARNVALRHAMESGLLLSCHIVGFPDDDCLYPAQLLRSVAEGMMATGAQVLCGTYGPTRDQLDRRRFPDRRVSLTIRTAPALACSGAMFMTSLAVAKAGAFDERLGRGAMFSGGEDADYVMRVLDAGLHAVYVSDMVFVEHPYRAHRAAEYFEGGTAVLAKHAIHHPRLVLSLAYRLLVGARLLIKRRLPPSSYARGLRAAVVMLRARGSSCAEAL